MDKEQERKALEEVVEQLDNEIAAQFGQQLAELRVRLDQEEQAEDFELAVINRLDRIVDLLQSILNNVR